MSAQVGDTAKVIVQFKYLGNPAAGITAPTVSVYNPSGSTVSNSVGTEIGSAGAFLVTFTPLVAGDHLVVATTVGAPVDNSIVTTVYTVDSLLTKDVPTSNVANSVGDCLNAARADGFGKAVFDPIGLTWKLYAPDNSTVVKNFTVDAATPKTRT